MVYTRSQLQNEVIMHESDKENAPVSVEGEEENNNNKLVSQQSFVVEDEDVSQVDEDMSEHVDTQEEEEEDSEEEEEEEEEEQLDSEEEAERQQAEYDMEQLNDAIPSLREDFLLVERLGEGTFSSVYKAIDLKHDYYDNESWIRHEMSEAGQVCVAIKRIYVTSSPDRIRNEIDILLRLRGSKNVAYLLNAVRHEDQVIAVMPYNRHQDFRTYFRDATMATLRSYFHCMFSALAATHKQQIIHRDVKPANFLYDIYTGHGVLCDYGLAECVGHEMSTMWAGACLHSLPGPSWGGLSGRDKSTKKLAVLEPHEAPGLSSGLHGVRLQRPLSTYDQMTEMERQWRSLKNAVFSNPDNKYEARRRVVKLKPHLLSEKQKHWLAEQCEKKEHYFNNWRPSPRVGPVNRADEEKIGYLKEDKRPSVRANRAGTRGFRAPEVLFKCPDQTVALDIWSAGIVLLCFLTRRFPFFNSNDDTEALLELVSIFGRRKMERAASLHNRSLLTNISTYEQPPHANLHALVKALNPAIFVENSPDPSGPIPSLDDDDEEWYGRSELYHAVDMMKRCLEVDCTKRWTAEELLEHPFFKAGKYEVGGIGGATQWAPPS